MSTFVPKTNVPTRNRASSRVSSHEKEKNRRVLWILNHTTLLEWQVPMLRELGFEVYVPKKLPVGPNSRTATVTDAHDRSLSIPSADLEHLNTVNFYDSPLDAQTARIINRHFGNCISASIYPGLYYILKAFTGRIFMRAFGHAGAIDYEEATATIPKDSLESGSFFHFRQEARKLFHSVLNRRRVAARVAFRNTVMMEMYACRHRIYLAAAYREIIDNERAFLKARSLYLPLALPPSIMRTRHSWNPEDNRVLFICPNIDQIDYYRRIYLQFKEELGHFPYCIAGRQDLNGVNVPLTTRDPNILDRKSTRLNSSHSSVSRMPSSA